jgi:hypothetical protein
MFDCDEPDRLEVDDDDDTVGVVGKQATSEPTSTRKSKR